MAPTSAMASTTTRVRLEGAGFEESGEHALHLVGEAPGAALVAACEVLGAQALECSVPPWPHPAQTAEVFLTVGGVRVPERAEFTMVAWVASVSPSEGAINAGGVVTVSGGGFDVGKRYAGRFSCDGQSAVSLLASPVSAQDIVFAVPQWRYGACVAGIAVEEEDGAPPASVDGAPSFSIVAAWSGVSATRAPCCLAPSELRIAGAFSPASHGVECVFTSLSDPSVSRRSAALADTASCDAFKCLALVCETPLWDAPVRAVLSLTQDGRRLPSTAGEEVVVDFEGEGWGALEPSRAFVDGGAAITVLGSGFAADASYTLLLSAGAAASSAECAVLGPAALVCALARWPAGAASARASLRRGDSDVVSKAGGEASLSLDEYWVGMSLVRSSVRGGDELLLLGNGFSAARAYTCDFESDAPALSVPATYVSGDTLSCTTPEWQGGGAVRVVVRHAGRTVSFGPGRAVSVDPAVVPNPMELLEVLPLWTQTCASIARVLDGESTLVVEGRGFSAEGVYSCRVRLTEDPSVEVVSEEAAVASGSELRCVFRGWRARERSAWTLAVLQGGAEVEHGGAAPWVVSYSAEDVGPAWELDAAVGSCAGDDDLVVSGFGFLPSREYVCSFKAASSEEAVQVAARFLSSLELRCALPAWSGLVPHVAFSLLEAGVALQRAGGGADQAFAFGAAWWFSEMQVSGTGGGDAVAIEGCGLAASPALYRLKFVGTDRAGRVQAAWSEPVAAEGARVVFRAPGWNGHEQVVRGELLPASGGAAVSFAARGATGIQLLGSVVRVEHSAGNLESTVEGGSRLDMQHRDVVHAPGTRFVCRFAAERGGNLHDSPVLFARDGSTGMSCAVPEWSNGWGDASVSVLSISASGEEHRRRVVGESGAVAFRFLAGVDAVRLEGASAAGVTVVASGRGFGDRPVRCLLHSSAGEDLGTSAAVAPRSDVEVECCVAWAGGGRSVGHTLPGKVRVVLVDEAGVEVSERREAALEKVPPAWSLGGGMQGPACGGTRVEVRAWGVSGADRLVLRFISAGGSVDAPLLSRALDAESAFEVLAFEAPPSSSAGGVGLQLRSDVHGSLELVGEDAPRTFTYVATWSGMSAARGPASGGTVLDIAGCGLEGGGGVGELRCVFTEGDAAGSKSTWVRAQVDGGSVKCVTPAWMEHWPESHVSLQRGGESVAFVGSGGNNTFRFVRSWTGLRGGEALRESAASGGDTLLVDGTGFVPGAPHYRCVFRRGASHLSTPAAAESTSALACATPAWGEHFPAAGDATVHLSVVNGDSTIDFEGAAPPVLRFLPAVLSSSPRAAPAASPTTLRFAASGLDPAVPLTCSAVGEGADGEEQRIQSAPALPESVSAFACVLPPWSGPAGVVRVHVSDSDGVLVRSPPELSLEYAPVWRGVSARTVGAAGGAVHVLGAGFVRGARYTLSLTAEEPRFREEAACEAASSSSLSCTLPRWTAAATLVTLTLTGPSGAAVAYAGDADGSVVEITAEWEAMRGPSVGSARGGSAITVRAAGLAATSSFVCEFSIEDGHAQRSSPVLPESGGVLVCVAPAWTSSAGVCDVRVLHHPDGALVPPAAAAAPFLFRIAPEWAAVDVSLSATDGLLSLAVHGAGFDGRPGRVACFLV